MCIYASLLGLWEDTYERFSFYLGLMDFAGAREYSLPLRRRKG